jgi:uncharacterized protein (TIGR02246 family)
MISCAKLLAETPFCQSDFKLAVACRVPAQNENIPTLIELSYHGAANSTSLASVPSESEGAMRLSFVFAILVFAVLALAPMHAPRAQNQTAGSDADSAAIKKVCGDFSENFSRHDAHGVAMTFAEDADFTNMTGRRSHGRADIETWFAGLFRGNLKDSQRTDTVKSIRFFTPELAAVDADTVITGTHAADGSEIPPRKGLMIVMMTKENGRWFIGTFHEAEYPAPRGGVGNSPTNNPTR